MSHKIIEEDLIAELHRLADELGRLPTVREMNELGEYSHMPYVQRYGSWTEAVEAAGLEPNNPGRRDISEEELLDEIKRLAQELGRDPTCPEMDEYGKFSDATYVNRFGSWVAAKNKALSEEVVD